MVISTKNTAAQLEINLGSYLIKIVIKKTTLNLIHEFITLYDNRCGIKPYLFQCGQTEEYFIGLANLNTSMMSLHLLRRSLLTICLIGRFLCEAFPQSHNNLSVQYQLPSVLGDSLPPDFPHIESTMPGITASGKIFLSNLVFHGSTVSYLMILKNSGDPIFYRKMQSPCLDFKLQPNGLLTYFDVNANKYYGMDSLYVVVDSFMTGNGYAPDEHELLLLPNGHALLMAYDSQAVDMSSIVPDGNPSATVIGLIIQEIDQQKDVVFQWRSWDHFQITDATHENLTTPLVDYIHGNSLDLDSDGNILLSSRHLDEVTKINRQTGEIIWRWGGKNNQFAFINDSLGFSHQHSVRRLANGNVLMFDNGNFHSPPFSRAVEYQLDEQGKTATLVWQYRNTPDAYGFAMGYTQRLENGNTLIGWGATNPTVTEIRADGSKVYELTLASGVYSYRAFRFPWKETVTDSRVTDYPENFSLSQNYPNPFNSSTTILLRLPREETVSLKVYDILGRLITTRIDGEKKSAGVYEITFDAGLFASGTYVYRLIAEHSNQTRTMQLIK